VILSARHAELAVEFHVCDEGTGFPPQFLPRAFQRFGRADESRSGEGAGLGLTIVETIARAHQGTATVANRRDGGADAAVRLPVAGAPDAAGRGHGPLSAADEPSRP
jgi:two-component system OmpR family sensor kinase